NFPQLGIMLNETCRRLHLASADQVLQLQSVNRGLAFEVVVGNHVCDLRLARDLLDTWLPLCEFTFAVQIVIAVGRLLVLEPLIIVAAVETNIADRRGCVRGGSDGASQERLINVAEADTLLRE